MTRSTDPERGQTELERRVYGTLAQVPSGRVTTYMELARAIGLKNGQRAIGGIMNRNPYPVIIPCHRVVMSTGEIGGYAYGRTVKEKMLSNEGIEITGGKKIADMERVMYRFDAQKGACGQPHPRLAPARGDPGSPP